jgi:hypothetical protein
VAGELAASPGYHGVLELVKLTERGPPIPVDSLDQCGEGGLESTVVGHEDACRSTRGSPGSPRIGRRSRVGLRPIPPPKPRIPQFAVQALLPDAHPIINLVATSLQPEPAPAPFRPATNA